MNVQIEILKPEVRGILDQLVKLELIKISEKQDNIVFTDLLQKIRTNAPDDLDLDEISKEVELVRTERFAQKQTTH